jgi:NDP-sugar pyrophosphorylase family protein
MDGRFIAPPFDTVGSQPWISADARVEDGAKLEGPCFVAEGVTLKPGSRIGPYSVIGRQCHIEEDAVVEGGILWANSWVGREARVGGAILGRHCHVGRNAIVPDGAILGDKSVLTDFTRF